MQSTPDVNKIFSISGNDAFDKLALEVFSYQFNHNQIYRSFCNALKKTPKTVATVGQIPFLPISFFQSHRVVAFEGEGQTTFTSSGTTGTVPSSHYVYDLSVYEKSFMLGFEYFYENLSQYIFLALLPGYMQRSGSSLVFMVNSLIQKSGNTQGGFYLQDLEMLASTLERLHKSAKKVVLIGVSFALLDLAENFPVKIPNTIIMETGGMKGKRKELIREELHQIIKQAFGVKVVHSEYGMTELLSQAYSKGNGIFECPPWMKVVISDATDPLSISPPGKSGGINIIDLANIHSCSFIATQDLGRLHPHGKFEVLGRFDHSNLRGCNLMID